MTVGTGYKSGPYAGDGVSVDFNITFYFKDQTHIKVTKLDTLTDTESTLVLTTNYSVSGVGTNPPTGKITALVAPLSTDTITITRNVPLDQQSSYPETGRFPAKTNEGDHDLSAMRDQQLQEQVDRTLKFPVSSTANPPSLSEFAAPEDGATLVYDFALNKFVAGATGDEIINAQAYAVLASQWASLTSGIVASTEYSAKAWAVGGTNVSATANRGSAKEWAISATSPDGTSSKSSKSYAADAAASAIAAATFNPALYALLAGAAFTGSVSMTGSAKFLTIRDTGASSNFLISQNSSGNCFINNQTASGTLGFYTNNGSGGAITLYSGGEVGLTARLGIGGVPAANLLLDVQGTTGAFAPPRGTTTNKNAIGSPTAGMIFYDTTLSRVAFYNSAWDTLAQGLGNIAQAAIIQATSTYTAFGTGASHNIPNDDTPPTTSETEAILSALTVIPVSATNYLEFNGKVCNDIATSGTNYAVGLYKDATTTVEPGLLFIDRDDANGNCQTFCFNGRVIAGSTTSRTYTPRMGTMGSIAFYINGDSSSRKYGGALETFVKCLERNS